MPSWTRIDRRAPLGFAWWAHSWGLVWRLASDVSPELDFAEVRTYDGHYYDDHGGHGPSLERVMENLNRLAGPEEGEHG
jgi:hypothetical protein